jgi:hypothetical protein
MTWFKVDDHLAFHSKVVEAGNAAMGLWVRAGSWSAAHLTDGFVPNRIVIILAEGDGAQADALVAANLWLPADGGYQFHDWVDQQPSSHDVKERRRREADRKAEWRARRKGQVNEGDEVESPRTSGGTDAPVPEMSQRDTLEDGARTEQGGEAPSGSVSRGSSALPDPTRPDPKGSVATHLGEVGSPQEGGVGGEPSRKRSGGSPRGTRIPEDFQPRAEDVEWFRRDCPHIVGRGRELTDEFRDYWLARSGKDATKIDWFKTWRNRMRDREERERNRQQDRAIRTGGGGVGSSVRSTTDERIAALDRFKSQPEQPQLGLE